MAKPARTARPKKAAQPETGAPAPEAPETAPPSAHPDAELGRSIEGPPSNTVTTLPLFALCLSGLNVRHTERDADIAALAEDIAARGLKQNLVVIPAHFSTAEEVENYGDRFEVIAGGRRYQAMKLLVADGRLPHDHPVPVMVESRGEARETSLSENLHRVAMNPADEFEAFAQIARRDTAEVYPDPVAYIAKRFGVTQRHVAGRLRLAALAPEILEALRAGTITLDSAKAYAGTEDHALQLKVFAAQQKSQWNPHDPRTVRDALRGATLSLSDGRVIWIGIDAYRAAGGRTEAEMFMGTDGQERVTDIALLDRLCAEKAAALLAAQAEADGYASALFAPGCGHVSKKPKPPEGFMQRGYEYSVPEPEVKRQRIAVYTVHHDGTGLYLAESYKPVEDQKPTSGGYVPPTPEERAAAERQQLIEVWTARLAIGPFAGTPLEGRAFYPDRHWNSVQWEFADDAEAQAEEDEGVEPDAISALVDIRIRVTAEAMAAVREAAEAKADEYLREHEDRRLAAQLKREAEQAAREAEADDEEDDDDSEFSPEDESCASDDTDLEGEDS